MKLISDEKLAKLIEEAFDKGIEFQKTKTDTVYPSRQAWLKKLTDRSLQQASEQ